MAENAEDRFKRAMDLLFTSPASSSVGETPSKQGLRGIPLQKKHSGSITAPSAKLENTKSLQKSTNNRQALPSPVCRPWDRTDLFKRLATFKSLTWFGKPEVAGPVNCARKGWVNVDVDLVACECCNAMLSFPSSSTWSQQQAENAATSFSDKLDSAHKDHCPWKGNTCSETLAQFPPTRAEVLIETFRDRCDALLQLPALPSISSQAVKSLMMSKAPQLDHLLAQPVFISMLESKMIKSGIESKCRFSNSAETCTYYQALALISLCGWELRMLPYLVDSDNESRNVGGNSPQVAKIDKLKKHRYSDPGPSVLIYHTTDKMEEKGHKKVPNQEQQRIDLGSAVLDCRLCGASVGLWPFSRVLRPPVSASAEPADVREFESAPSACGVSAGSEIEKGGKEQQQKDKFESCDEVVDTVTSALSNASTRAGLDLKLTIAGGPRPTVLKSCAFKSIVPSSIYPKDLQSTGGDETYQIGRGQGVKVEDQACKNDKNQVTSYIIRDEGEVDDMHTRKRKRYDVGISDVRECLQFGPKAVHYQSSVDAVDTCFQNRQENSSDTVEMSQEHFRGTAASEMTDKDDASKILHGAKQEGVLLSSEPKTYSDHAIAVVEGFSTDSRGKSMESIKDRVFMKEKVMFDGVRVEADKAQSESCNGVTLASDGMGELTKLWEEESKNFNPVLQHRHFCPWANTGWQLTLAALEASPADVGPETASSIDAVDPLVSVRKIFGNAQKSHRTPKKQKL